MELVGLVENKTISTAIAQQVFAEMFDTGESPAAIVRKKGLAQVSDTSAIEKFCEDVIAANPGPVADFKKGKYQGKPDTQAWDNAPLAYGSGKWTKGDRASWENQIKTRQLGQNEDVRINQ